MHVRAPVAGNIYGKLGPQINQLELRSQHTESSCIGRDKRPKFTSATNNTCHRPNLQLRRAFDKQLHAVIKLKLNQPLRQFQLAGRDNAARVRRIIAQPLNVHCPIKHRHAVIGFFDLKIGIKNVLAIANKGTITARWIGPSPNPQTNGQQQSRGAREQSSNIDSRNV